MAFNSRSFIPQVPDYCPTNDPLFSYATPLHPAEEHTTTRPDIPGGSRRIKQEKDIKTEIKQEVKEEEEEESKERLLAVAAVKADHAYTDTEEERPAPVSMPALAPASVPTPASASPPAPQRRRRNRWRIPNSERLDYSTIEWPRDALYLPYEPKFEYLSKDAELGKDSFCCDCHDPKNSRRKKTEEDDSDDEDEDDEDDEVISNDSEELVNGIKRENSNSSTPGWFGKGRRKKCRGSFYT